MTLIEDAEWKNLIEMRAVIRSADEVIVESGGVLSRSISAATSTG